MKAFLLILTLAAATLTVPAQQPGKQVQPGTPVTIQVASAPASSPAVTITLAARHGMVTPHRQGLCHTGAGNIDVAQPAPDTVVITMTGAAVAVGTACGPGVASMDFDLQQSFEIVFEKSDVKASRLTLDGRIIGLLRSHKMGNGMAEESHGYATVLGGNMPLTSVSLPDHAVAGGDNRSINDHDGPASVTVGAGKYTLRQVLHILASHPRSLLPCKAASAEFAPDPALDPLWISYWEPFHGANKKDFGFQVTMKVAQDTETPPNLIPIQPKTLTGSK